ATVNTYLAIPFFALFGIHVITLRAMPIVQSMTAMVFLYLLARELFNRRVAMIAVLLLAFSPSFVFWSRQGVFVTSVTIPISTAAVWIWLRWLKTNKAGYLYAGAFLFGLGISAKFLFCWLVAGVVGAFVLLNVDRLWACLRAYPRERSLAPLGLRLRWRDVIIAGILILIGLLPLIVFNVQTRSTIKYIQANVSSSSYWEVDNTNIAENLRERIKQLRSVLNGETFWYLAIHPYASWRYPSVFLLAVGVAAFALFGRAQGEKRPSWARWLTLTLVVGLGYTAVFRADLDRTPWLWWILSLGLLAPLATVLLLARRAGWKAWLEHGIVGMGSALMLTIYIYLAWKLGQWQPPFKVYVLGILTLIAAPWLCARQDARKAMFPVLVLLLMLSLSVFTPTALWFTHLAIGTPWPALAIAAVADMVARNSGLDRLNLGCWIGRKWASGLSLGLLAILALAGMLIYDDLEVDAAYHHELAIVGGKGDHTPAIYPLVEYLQREGLRDVVAMDMGIQDPVQFLTAGEINPVEVFGYENRADVDGAFAIRVREQLENPDNVYVFHVTYPIFRRRWETFQSIVEQDGKIWEEVYSAYDWSAIPIFRVVQVK
ncbi:MAG: glycosyltransferase family 39 protein, partial [Anaerolineae bacterium]|nr:glycosyltransferase family 39 protein [Anaerolineae bacterium]